VTRIRTARALAALLAMFRAPVLTQHRMMERREWIVETVAAASERWNVAPELILVLGYLESHLGTDRSSGGSFGNPESARHRERPGTVDGAARILATGMRICTGDMGVISYWRCGACHCPPLRGYDPPEAVAILHRVRAAASVGGGPVTP
jgi:hypothetical protein